MARLRALEICSGCGSVSTAAGKEAREHFGIADVEVFSVDGKPGTNASRVVDMLTYDWKNDELLRKFRHEREEGRTHQPAVRRLLGNVLPHTRATFAAGSALGRLSRAALPGSHQLFRPRELDRGEQGTTPPGLSTVHARNEPSALHRQLLQIRLEQMEEYLHLDKRAHVDARAQVSLQAA